MSRRIDDIKKRAQAATPGPWWWREDLLLLKPINLSEIEGCAVLPMVRRRDDYAFIAHAREDVPYLLERLERAESLLENFRHGVCWDGSDYNNEDVIAFLSENK